jgi:hypothetical protein
LITTICSNEIARRRRVGFECLRDWHTAFDFVEKVRQRRGAEGVQPFNKPLAAEFYLKGVGFCATRTLRAPQRRNFPASRIVNAMRGRRSFFAGHFLSCPRRFVWMVGVLTRRRNPAAEEPLL